MRLFHQRSVRFAAAAATLALAAAACGGGGDDDNGGSSNASQDLKGQKLEVAAVWTGTEQAGLRAVLDAFSAKTGATVTITPTGDNVATFLDSKLQGGAPPDVAFLPQQGVLVQFAKANKLKPLSADAQQAVSDNFAKVWSDFATVDGKLYGVYFKAANKSTVWYRPQAFSDAGITDPPGTWDEFVKDVQTLSDSGVTPLSVAGADGWTLTDWFENVYLSQAGPDMYDKLSKHEIPWTDPSVTKALTTLAQLWGKPNLIAGGTSGALQTDFPTSVSNVFAGTPKAAVVYEGDFAAANIKDAGAKLGTDAKFFPFPSAGATAPVLGGGDVAVAMKDSKAAQELLAFLATADAAKVWASRGGFTSPNKNLDPSAYPDDITREIAKAVIDAGDKFRFDMSDLAPAAFGGTKGVGEWKDLQDFLARPAGAAAAAAKLEADAKKTFTG